MTPGIDLQSTRTRKLPAASLSTRGDVPIRRVVDFLHNNV